MQTSAQDVLPEGLCLILVALASIKANASSIPMEEIFVAGVVETSGVATVGVDVADAVAVEAVVVAEEVVGAAAEEDAGVMVEAEDAGVVEAVEVVVDVGVDVVVVADVVVEQVVNLR